MTRRFNTRAWKSVRDRTVEATVLRESDGDAVGWFVEDDEAPAHLTNGQLFLSTDPHMAWETGDENGAGLYLILDVGDEYVRYISFMGDRDQMWRSTSDPVSTFTHLLKRDEIIPLTAVRRPSSAILPMGVEYNSETGLQVTDAEAALERGETA